MIEQSLYTKRILFYCVVIDVLLMPYISIMGVRMLSSMIIVTLWVMLNLRILIARPMFIATMAFVLLGLVSIAAGIVLYGPVKMWQSLEELFMITYYIILYIYIYENDIMVSSVMRIFVVVCVGLASIYVINPQVYFNIRSFFTVGGRIIQFKNMYFNRFTYLCSDPNNCSCLMIAVGLWILLFDTSLVRFERVIFLILSFMTSLVTMSTMGIITLGICSAGIIVCCFNRILHIEWRTRKIVLLLLALLCECGLVAVAVFNKQFLFFANTYLLRIGNNFDLANSISYTHRVNSWKGAIEGYIWPLYFLWGRGKEAVGINGYRFMGYNGHFHIILQYGFIAYSIWMFIFYRKPKNAVFHSYLVVVPSLVAFSINSLVSDFRASLGFVVLAACYHATYEKNTCSVDRCM